MAGVRRKLYPEVSQEQLDFQKGKCSQKAIFVMRILATRSKEMQDVYAAFKDYEKAFDKVKHEIMKYL